MGADYVKYGAEVCHELYTCENYNDDAVFFMITHVFETKLPMPDVNNPNESGRGMHYWFTEVYKFMNTLAKDECKSLVILF